MQVTTAWRNTLRATKWCSSGSIGCRCGCIVQDYTSSVAVEGRNITRQAVRQQHVRSHSEQQMLQFRIYRMQMHNARSYENFDNSRQENSAKQTMWHSTNQMRMHMTWKQQTGNIEKQMMWHTSNRMRLHIKWKQQAGKSAKKMMWHTTNQMRRHMKWKQQQ